MIKISHKRIVYNINKTVMNPDAVIETNSWGSAAYEKIIRGNVVNTDTLKEAMKTAVESHLLFVDSARDYGFGKGPKLIGLCCPDEIRISSKYTPFTKFKPGQVRESIEKDLKDFGRSSIEVYWLHMPNDIPQYMGELIELYREGKIGNIGVSNFNLQECKIAKDILNKAGIPWYGVQNHYSLIDREWEKNGLLSWCRENGVQFWALTCFALLLGSDKINIFHKPHKDSTFIAPLLLRCMRIQIIPSIIPGICLI